MAKALIPNEITGPILVVLPKFIGDAINTLSAISLLRQLYPNNQIHLLVRPFMAELFARDTHYNVQVIADTRHSVEKTSIWQLAQQLKNHRFALAFLLRGSFSEALLCKLAGIKKVIGYAQNGRGPLLSHAIKLNQNHHYLLRYSRLINETHGQPFSEFPLPKLTAVKKGDSQIGDNTKLIGIYFGGKNKGARHYPAQQAKAALTQLNSAKKCCFILLGDKTEQADNQVLATHLNEQNIPFIDHTGNTSLSELVDHIASLDLLVSIDSGPMHMAAAVDTPCVAIVGQGTSPWSLVAPKKANILAATAAMSLKLNDTAQIYDILPEHITKLSTHLLEEQRRDDTTF